MHSKKNDGENGEKMSQIEWWDIQHQHFSRTWPSFPLESSEVRNNWAPITDFQWLISECAHSPPDTVTSRHPVSGDWAAAVVIVGDGERGGLVSLASLTWSTSSSGIVSSVEFWLAKTFVGASWSRRDEASTVSPENVQKGLSILAPVKILLNLQSAD